MCNMVKIGHRICNFVSSYSSLKQFYCEFENFWKNFELILDDSSLKPILLAVTVDFNAKSSNWYTSNIAISEGSKTETMFFQFGLQ